jgi:hypothetical protein
LIFRINKCGCYLPEHYTRYLCTVMRPFFVGGRN